MAHVLVIDDDTELCELLTEYLSAEGFDVNAVHDGRQGMEEALHGGHDLVVLDVMLPGASGFDVLRRIREASPLPVIMLTARGDDVDRIVGLELGADDYLPKPFNPRELAARIRAILRRSQPRETDNQCESLRKLAVGDVVMDTGTRMVWREGQSVELTSVEFNVLEILLRAAGRVVSREDLVRTVLSREISPYDRSIDVHMSSLRKKLGHRIGDFERIRTVRGVGYLYASTPSSPA